MDKAAWSNMHPVVAATRKESLGSHPAEYGFLYLGYNGGSIKMRVGPENLDRALRLFGTLFKMAEQRGHKVGIYQGDREDGAFIEVDGEDIKVSLMEQLSKSDGPKGCLTILVEDYWSPKPKRNWAEGGRWRQETRLEMILAHIESAAKHKKAFFDEQRREEQVREAQHRRAAEEREKARILLERVSRWRQAREIRDFVADVRSRATGAGRAIGSAEAASLTWALNHADANDPAREPMVLLPENQA